MQIGFVRGKVFSRLAQTFQVVLVLTLLAAPQAVAVESSGSDSAICSSASRFAAAKTGVPLDVLRAISLTETGRRSQGRLQPWPWTVNMQGKGKWFDSRAEALAFTQKHFTTGARSFDVGCFQINYRWHGGAFPSIDAMFDPNANALYAAQFLQTLFAETGSWSRAAGAYHSRTPKFANAYRQRFERILARLSPENAPPVAAPVARQPDASAPRPPKSILNGALLASQLDTDQGTTSPGSLVILAVRSDGWSILTPARGALY